MRMALTALLFVCAFGVSGCAGMKLGTGYRFDTQEFFLTIEKPLGGYKK
jgi:hypothetical protein